MTFGTNPVCYIGSLKWKKFYKRLFEATYLFAYK